MDNMYKLLMQIQKRPEIYIGKVSLERLYTFINGYKQRAEEEPGYSDCLDGFQKYIEEHYNLNTDHNWASLIQFFCTSEEEAFDSFYNYLDEFLKDKISQGKFEDEQLI